MRCEVGAVEGGEMGAARSSFRFPLPLPAPSSFLLLASSLFVPRSSLASTVREGSQDQILMLAPAIDVVVQSR